jgi:glycosyltransferase involved in cell wall biosynthesis
MSPKVSVVITCRNEYEFLERAVDSCLNSAYMDIEIVVVDYGSLDQPEADAAGALSRMHKPKTRIIRQHNQGISHARNTGIRETGGEYILTFDADDLLHRELIGRSVDFLGSHPEAGFVTPGYRTFGAYDYVWQPPSFQLGRLTVENCVCIASLFRREAWLEAGGFNEEMAEGYEDWDFWLKLAERGWVCGTLPEPLFYYRVYPPSPQQEAAVRHDRLFSRIRMNHPELYRQERWAEQLLDYFKDGVKARGLMRSILGDAFTMDPLVSVVIPCYNYGQYVVEAVDSCLASTFQDIEVVVVNNGSTDPHTNEVLKDLRKPRTRVIHVKHNVGLSNGRNVGIQAARGKYILPLDADDKIHPTLIEKTFRVLEQRPEVGFVTVGLEYFGDLQWSWVPPPFDMSRLLRENIVCVASLFRKQAWKDAGGYNESMLDGYEDWDFWISLAEKGWQGDVVPEPLLHYRRHGRNMSTESGKKHDAIVRQIHANHPGLYS